MNMAERSSWRPLESGGEERASPRLNPHPAFLMCSIDRAITAKPRAKPSASCADCGYTYDAESAPPPALLNPPYFSPARSSS